jgi:hypothetical protein
MTGPPRRLKQPTGWFAAGREVAQALHVLPDGAFKLFIWICLTADRSLGAIRTTPGEIARALGKTDAEIQTNLRDLYLAEIGQPTADGAIHIADRYWPYERAPTGRQAEHLAVYIGQLKRVFLDRRCVRSVFTAADEKFAIRLYEDGFSIADVEHAILLGSLRKYIALTNNGGGTPITSLRYFAALLDEVRQNVAPDYWVYVARKVSDAERKWAGFDVTGQASDEIRMTK